MNTNQSFVAETDQPSSPVAQIMASDITEANSLREFLEASGCTVMVNEKPAKIPDYFIAIGNADFVKSIVAKREHLHSRALAVIYKTGDVEFPLKTLNDVKSVYLGSTFMSATQVKSIFRFLFTGDDLVLDLSEGKIIPEIIAAEHLPKTETVIGVKNFPTPANPTPQPPTISDHDRISQTISEVFADSVTVKPKHRKPAAKKRRVFKIIAAIFLVALAPPLTYLISLSAGMFFLWLSVMALKSDQPERARPPIIAAQNSLAVSRVTLAGAGVVSRMLSRTTALRTQEQILSALNDIAAAGGRATKLLQNTKLFSQKIMAELVGRDRDSSESVAKLMENIRSETPLITDRLGLAEAQLNKLLADRAFPFNHSFIANQTRTATAMVSRIRGDLVFAGRLLLIYPYISGFSQKQTYLILLQNSMELRPTGGFIGSIGNVSFSQGVIGELNIQDVYAVDGQLKGHVDPPLPIRELLGQEHWYLRDSNWNPDFTQSGKTAAWFYEKETAGKVDGVIAISTPFLTELLRLTGPLRLPDFNDTITADNFYGKSLFYVQSGFFPGSTQKKDFLGSLFQAVVNQLTQTNKISPWQSLGLIKRMLSSHEIMFYFTNPEIQSLIREYGWAGEAENFTACQIPTPHDCVADGTRIVEANLSVSKVNYFIHRKNYLQVQLREDGTITESHRIIFDNTSSGAKGEGGGTYRVYLRLFAPAGVTYGDILLDGQKINPRTNFKIVPAVPFTEWEESSASGKTLALVLDIPTKSQTELQWTRFRPGVLSKTPDNFGYEYLLPKQPGVGGDSLEAEIIYPASWTAQTNSTGEQAAAILANPGSLKYNSTIDQDVRLGIIFRKKL